MVILSRPLIPVRDKPSPAESVVCLSVSPASGYQTTRESQSRVIYKKRQQFQCLRSKIPEFHDALWLKEGLHSQTHGYSIAAVIARMHTHTHAHLNVLKGNF